MLWGRPPDIFIDGTRPWATGQKNAIAEYVQIPANDARVGFARGY